MIGITSLYPKDTLAPGFVLSYLENRKLFYASIVRYDGSSSDHTKQVLMSGTGETLEVVIAELILSWKTKTKAARGVQAMRADLDTEDMGDFQ